MDIKTSKREIERIEEEGKRDSTHVKETQWKRVKMVIRTNSGEKANGAQIEKWVGRVGEKKKKKQASGINSGGGVARQKTPHRRMGGGDLGIRQTDKRNGKREERRTLLTFRERRHKVRVTTQ